MKTDDAVDDSSNQLMEALKHLDLSQISGDLPSNSDSPDSYQSLHNIAKSIIALNVNQDFENLKDKKEYELTLRKLFQMCQMIIDSLLNDVKNQNIDIDINNHRNLIQENSKLRKLLTLQQKAIAYRRVNQLSHSYDPSSGDFSTLPDSSISTNIELPEDSKSKTSPQSNKFQCVFCPKLFNDTPSFIKHLSLRHSSSSIDDHCSNSATSPTNFPIYHRFRQQQNVYSYKENQNKISQLETEIDSLKNKLVDTENALTMEKSARQSFESGLQSNVIEQLNTTQKQLNEKIEEIKFLRNEALIAAEMAATANRSCSELINNLKHNQLVHSSESIDSNRKTKRTHLKKRKSTSSGESPDTATRESNSKDSDVQTNVIDSDSRKQSSTTLKDNVSETAKRKLSEAKLKVEAPKTESIKEEIPVQTAETKVVHKQETLNDPKDLKKSLRLQLIEELSSKREEHKQNGDTEKMVEVTPNPQSQQINNAKSGSSSSSNKAQTKADIFQSLENRLKNYLEQNEHKAETDKYSKNEESFSKAMDQLQRDRSLLIEQSRHDYDFVQIENSIRSLVDLKAKSKFNSNEQESKEVAENLIKDEEIREDDSSEEEAENEPLLRSILKRDNKPELAKDPMETKRISFNESVIEYEISPRQTDDSDLDSDELEIRDDPIEDEMNENSMFVIKSYDDTAPAAASDGEKIYLNSFPASPSTSTSSSEDEAAIQATGENRVVDVEVHYSDNSIPIPAKRKSTASNQTLNSLLYDEDHHNGESSDRGKTRVHELAELIESKLQKPTRPASASLKQKLPPIGSVDTLGSLRTFKNSFKNSPDSTKENDQYDIYDF